MTNSILGTFDLGAEAKRFAPGEGESGRRAETLIKTDQLRVVLVTLREGAALHEHTAPGPITIQALQGRITVTAEGNDHRFEPGGLISIAAGVKHAVRGDTASAFLLTIAWPKGVQGEPAAVESQ